MKSQWIVSAFLVMCCLQWGGVISCTPPPKDEPTKEAPAETSAEPQRESAKETQQEDTPKERTSEKTAEPNVELPVESIVELPAEPNADVPHERTPRDTFEQQQEPIADAAVAEQPPEPATPEPATPEPVIPEPSQERMTPDWGTPDDILLEKVQSNINWASLQWPPSVTFKEGKASRAIYGQVYVKGLTDTVKAAHPGLRAELGFGPWGTTPHSHPAQWKWVSATYVKNTGLGSNNHEYSATLPAQQAGLYHYAYRYSLYKGPWQVADRSDYGRKGTDDGVTLRELGVAVVVKVGATFRIGAMNLHCLIESPNTRFQALAKQWATLQLDVIGLQEVCAPSAGGADSAKTLATLLKKAGAGTYHSIFVPTHTATHGGVSYQEGLGLLTRVPVIEHHHTPLPATGTPPTGAFPRKMLWARLATPVGVVSLGSIHLSYRSDHESWRVKQVDTLKDVLSSNEAWGNARIVVGDFNAKQQTTPITNMGKQNQPTGAMAFSDLLKGYDTGLTFPAKNPSIRIDFLFMAQPSAALPLQAKDGKRLFLKPLSGGIYLSDHLGLRATLGVQ